ncbi:MAG TPA: hypothetical protein VFT43_05805 [Candidatus Polarisedimenticolia bacterium]|nr:hypothetical protein [Candidatus Polarisedimenticolia bacterium]
MSHGSNKKRFALFTTILLAGALGVLGLLAAQEPKPPAAAPPAPPAAAPRPAPTQPPAAQPAPTSPPAAAPTPAPPGQPAPPDNTAAPAPPGAPTPPVAEPLPRIIRSVCTDHVCGGCDGKCNKNGGHVAVDKKGHCACTPTPGSPLDQATRQAYERQIKQ